MFIFISINIHIQKMIPCKIHLTVHISGSENILQTKHFHEILQYVAIKITYRSVTRLNNIYVQGPPAISK